MPCIVDVTVEVADDVADDDAVDVAVDVTVDVLGCVVTLDVAVVDAVVKSQLMYSPDCQRPMARLSAAAVVAHFENGDPPVESFKKPEELHCTDPKSESTYGVMSSMTWFKSNTPALHLVLSSNLSMLWFSVSASRWQLIFGTLLSHCSRIWFNSCLWLTQLFGDAPVSTFK